MAYYVALIVQRCCFSVLKMIAGLLPEDGTHAVGGSVEVNGVNSKEKDIVWSVSFVASAFRPHRFFLRWGHWRASDCVTFVGRTGHHRKLVLCHRR